MTTFKPRMSAPSVHDKNWIHWSKQGHNYCILIEGTSTLPNCVGYAWGRWRELLGAHHNLSRNNAEVWYGYKDGYARGNTPKEGAVICWRQGNTGTHKDGAGHVAIVEKVLQNGSIIISNSDYKGSRFYTRQIKPPYNIGSTFTLQGFIYLPKTYAKKLSNHEVAKLVLRGKYKNYPERKRLLEAEGYSYSDVQLEVEKIINKGNTPTPKPKKSIAEVARLVRLGVYKNGNERIKRLKAEGYDPEAVQAEVNRQLRK